MNEGPLGSAGAEGPALLIDSLEVRYGQALAVNGASIRVPAGQVIGIVGPNGAGKSSLLKAVSALVPVVGGRIEFDGHAIQNRSPRAIAELGVAHVPEGRRIFAKMSVYDNLLMGAYLLPAASRNDALERVFNAFPRLKERLRQAAGSMSGGEQQMVAIGRALMGNPRLIMADEVSQGLAPIVVQEVYRQLSRVAADGVGVLLVEQNARLAFQLASYIYVMEQGRVVSEGAAAELSRSEHVRNAYLGLD
ncbi:MAG: ABC transporter ATP-binding protein [Betaproteobacteria bacterium]|nr:ABC transporter ATP-binding protein [Betaproteobacteria bacterium]